MIRLQQNANNELLVTPSDSSPPFEPFMLPSIPLSMHCWLTGLGNEFRKRHNRCIAALLVLHCKQQRWVSPVIPSQTCSPEGSAWTLDLGPERLPPDHRIAGSFQIRMARDLMEAVDTVPEFDGYHIVQSHFNGRSVAYCFLHYGGETGVLPVQQAMEDDWAMALAEAMPRMLLE